MDFSTLVLDDEIYDKQFIIDKIKNHLIEMEVLKGKENNSKKAEIAVEIFKFLSKSQVIRDFVNTHEKFKQTVINKAYEFLELKEYPEVVDICIKFLEKLGYNQNRVE